MGEARGTRAGRHRASRGPAAHGRGVHRRPRRTGSSVAPLRSPSVLAALGQAEVNTRVLLALGVVIIASRAAGWLIARVRQPRVHGEILAGILLGPSLLGQ